MKKVFVCYPYTNTYIKVYGNDVGEVYFGSGAPWVGTIGKVIYTDYSYRTHNLPSDRLLVLEPPRVCPLSHEDEHLKTFERVYTFGKSELKNVQHYRYGIPPLWPEVTEINTRPWDGRHDKVVCVTGNKYPERVKLLDAYDKLFRTLRLGLDVWGRPGFEGKSWYRGEIAGGPEQKRELLSTYRYCLALENTCMKRYLSEKLLDGLAAGCFCFYYGGADAEFYPEVPWRWVNTTFSSTHNSTRHDFYLRYLTDCLSDLNRLNFNYVWKMILEDS